MARKTDEKKTKIAVRILQYFIVIVCLGLVIFTLGKGTIYFFKTSSIFKVREVVSQKSLQFIHSRTLDRLVGQSIFAVDLVAVQKKIQEEYPQIDHLRLYRQFPNRIYVDAIRRDPFALIMTRRQQILVDKEGTVLMLTAPSNSRLPVITGLNIDQVAVSGKPLKHSDVGLAISIIKTVQENPHLESMPIVNLNLTNLSRIQATLANQLKIILAGDKVDQKIMMLGILIKQSGIKPEDINYIDLRFKEPIISKKESAIKL